MTVKLIMTWNISPEHEQEYVEFVIGEFIPSTQRIGLQPAEAWATVYGDYPQILVSLLAEDLSTARRALASDSWSRIQEKLLPLVQDFNFKIIPARSEFQF